MFIVASIEKNPSSVRSVMATFRPYGTWILFATRFYKHFALTGQWHEVKSEIERRPFWSAVTSHRFDVGE